MKPYQLTLIGPKSRYHALHSGYEALTRYLPGAPAALDDAAIERGSGYRAVVPLLPRGFKAALVERSGLRRYSRAALVREAAAWWHLVRSRRSVVHHLYGEDTYYYTGLLPRRGHVVATFHLPPALLERGAGGDIPWSGLDAAIAVARCQIEFLHQKLGGKKAFWIPHGVDSEFFRPGEPEMRAPRRVLFVGTHLRDFDVLREAIDLVHSADPEVEFEVVAGKSQREAFAERPYVRFRSHVSEEELRAAYQRATALFLPLTDATATNSLLEGLACGVPMVASDVGGVRDYCDESSAVLIPPRNPRAAAEAIVALLDDEERCARLSCAARDRALDLDWKRIAPRIETVYEEICRS